MAISVKLRCSECETIREANIKADEKDITCPVCGRRLQNLTAAEHGEIEGVQKKQRMFCIISIVLFALAVVCIAMWMIGGDTAAWASSDASATSEAKAEFFIGAIVCMLASIVLGVLGSLKRFVVEF